MNRILALSLHPALYAALVFLQLWRARRSGAGIDDGGLGAGLLIAAALMAQVGFAICLIPFARRIRAAAASRVTQFAIVAAIAGMLLCLLIFRVGAQLEQRSVFPRLGYVVFVTAPFWASSLATLLSARWLLPHRKSTKLAVLPPAGHPVEGRP